jgi:DNA-binding CsgD family transcriptional regulator/transcriptional regulator with XRE-family HTH domain
MDLEAPDLGGASEQPVPQADLGSKRMVLAHGHLLRWERLLQKARDGSLTPAEAEQMIAGFDQASLQQLQETVEGVLRALQGDRQGNEQERLREVEREREHRGWTQDDLARALRNLAATQGEELGVDGNMVSRWERGVRSPQPRYVRWLSQLLGKTPEELGLVRSRPQISVGSPPADGVGDGGVVVAGDAPDARSTTQAAGPETGEPVPLHPSRLTLRELEVARLVAAGLTNKEIAERLYISERTVEGHIERIRIKLVARTRTEIAVWASRARLDILTPSGYDFDVALSYATEDRPYVHRVATALRERGVRVFYDADERVELWGKDLAAHFDDVYRNRCQFVVIFASRSYAEGAWPSLELRSVLARANRQRPDFLLPVRLDDSEMPGIPPTIGFVNAARTAPEMLADLIVAKLRGPARAESTTGRTGTSINETARCPVCGNDAPVFDRRGMQIVFRCPGCKVLFKRAPGPDESTATAERRTSLGVLLTAAERALASELEEGLRDAGYHDLRAAHAQILIAIEVEGSRLTDLAGRAGMTKQATGELVRYLEQHDYLYVEPDSRDRRAKLIRPTARGWSAHQASLALLAESDRRLAERLGEDALREMRTQLARTSATGN